MKTSTLKFQSHIPLPIPTANPAFLIPFKPKSNLTHPPKPPTPSQSRPPFLPPSSHTHKPMILSKGPIPRSQILQKHEISQVSANGSSRFVVIGAVSVGFLLFLMGMDEHKALALGPDGPLMEEFWDNVRRYGLYILTVSSGAIYTIFLPILELLKNPITAILLILILGGSIYIVSQVVSAMVGITEFSYDYSY